MSDLLTAVGKYQSIEEKQSGWSEIKIAMPGKQYPLRLATKRTSLIDAVRETKGELATFSYKEAESERINENTGKPYTNRYLEGVELGAASDGGGQSRPSQDNVDWDAKERRDFRSRAWAQTLSTFEHTIDKNEDPILVFNRLKPFQQLVFEDVCGDFAQQDTAAAAPTTVVDEPPHADDDIPF